MNLRTITAHFFPSLCVACGSLPHPLCYKCALSFDFRPHSREVGNLRVFSGLHYEQNSILGKSVQNFKYHGQADMAHFLSPFLARILTLFLEPEKSVLVPVPLHRKKKLDRGYNQSERLARNIGKILHIPVQNILSRSKQTLAQAQTTDLESRIENVHGAFEVNYKPASGYSFILVDDIVTSGSTLRECAQALQKSGANSVFALSLADRNHEQLQI